MCRHPASSVKRETGRFEPSSWSHRVTSSSATTSMAKVTSPGADADRLGDRVQGGAPRRDLGEPGTNGSTNVPTQLGDGG